ncbi:hypothetical protein T01_2042 [Trichinella spiralis]|uniref:Uncharacterized protein n=1 Tax=Trichinella spiralis TaxID=6334 RepID=A0A0V1B527_TRISP|nr:hypothetical protein T01_2042 [Trichinella spiralis]
MVDELAQICDEELYLDDIEELLEAVDAFYDKTLELQPQLEAAQCKKAAHGISKPQVNEKLPEPKLPVLSAKTLEFPAFWNRFQADVYCCEDLKNTKFTCLLAGLSADALTAIEGMSNSVAYYPHAVKLLNSGTIVQEHLKAFWDQKPFEQDLTAGKSLLSYLKEKFPHENHFAWDSHTRILAIRGGSGKLRREKRSMSAIEKLRSFGQGRETQKTVEFLRSSVDVVCDFCQRQYMLSGVIELETGEHVGLVVTVGTFNPEKSSIPHFLVQVSCRCDNANQPSFGKAVTAQPLSYNPSKGIRCCRSWSGIDVIGGEGQPMMVEGFSGATREHPSSQVVRLFLSWFNGGQSTKRNPMEVLTMRSLCHRLLDLISDDDSSDEVHVMTNIDYYHQLLETEGMGDSPKNGSDALDPEKRFREGHLFDGTGYSKYEIITGYD